MEIQEDQGILVMKLENCLSTSVNQQLIKGNCVYTVAVGTDTCGLENDSVQQIPVSVHCSPDVQQVFSNMGHLETEQINVHSPHYHTFNQLQPQFSQVDVQESLTYLIGNSRDTQVKTPQKNVFTNNNTTRVQPTQHAPFTNDSTDNYYSDIYNLLVSNILPEGSTENYKKALVKRAQHYCIIDGCLYYGNKQPKKVVTNKMQQQKILENTHIEDGSGIHLGVKKMYEAINRFYFWRGLYVDIGRFVRQCDKCSDRIDVVSPEEFGIGINDSICSHSNFENDVNLNCNGFSRDSVWQKVELRLLGPYPKTAAGNEYIISIVDPISKWICVQPVSASRCSQGVASFVTKSFCQFGFAECSAIGFGADYLKSVQTQYKEELTDLTNFASSMGNKLSTKFDNLHIQALNSKEECAWVTKLLDKFIGENSGEWDRRLQRFLFNFHTTIGNDSLTPYFKMFGRHPSYFDGDEKENTKKVGSSVCYGRRRLQNSILQCRHCEEIFTSKISFRIHQRKHTEEARLRGTLDGEDNLKCGAGKAKILSKRAAERKKQKIMRSCSARMERLLAIINQNGIRSGSHLLSRNRRHPAEVRASTVAAVRKLLATTKEMRKSRGKYRKYSSDLQEEMAKYAIEHGNLEAVRHFSSKLGSTVSESTIRNIVKWFQQYTPEVKEDIGRFASIYGVEAATDHFSQHLGRNIRQGIVQKFKKLYLSRMTSTSSKQEDKTQIKKGSTAAKPKTIFSDQLKEEIGAYAFQYNIASTIRHYSEKLNFTLKESTVRKFRRMYIDKSRFQEQQQEPQQHSSVLEQLQQGSSTIIQDSSLGQNVSLLQNSLHILNNPQLGASANVLYDQVYESDLQPSSHISINHAGKESTVSFQAQCNNITISQNHNLYTQEHVSDSEPIIMNDNIANVQNFQDHQLYSSFHEPVQSNSLQSLHSSDVSSLHHTVNVPQHPLHTDLVPSLTNSTNFPTITVALSSHNNQTFNQENNHPNTVVISHQPNQCLIPNNSIMVPSHHVEASLVQQLMTPHSNVQSQISGSELDSVTSSLNSSSAGGLHQSAHLPVQHDITDSVYPHTLCDNITALSFEHTNETLLLDQNSILVPNKTSLPSLKQNCAPIVKNIQVVTMMKDNDNLDQPHPILVSESMPHKNVETQENYTNETDVVSELPRVLNVLKGDSSGLCDKQKGAERSSLPSTSTQTQKTIKNGKKSSNSGNSKAKRGGKASQIGNKGNKRGTYAAYSPELRAEIGKYAAEHGSHKANLHFKEILGHEIAGSTIRGLRDKYLFKRELSVISDGNSEKEVTSLGYAQRGRPIRLGAYDQEVQQCIQELVKSGERISSFLAIATAKQVLLQYDPGLLEENGGSIKLTKTWAKSFLKRIGVRNNS